LYNKAKLQKELNEAST